jgi:hypothetical protein
MNDTERMPPKLETVLNELKSEIFATFNCIQIGKINKVTPADQTVEIELQIKRLAQDDTSTAYPILVDCPYFVLQGGGAYIDMPITAGDYCIVLFNDRDIDNWWSTANVADPATTRKHNLSDGIAIVGLNPKTSPLDQDGTWVRILGTAGPGSEAEAARKGDADKSTATEDAAFWLWVTTVSAALNALVPGSVPSVPASLTGKITGGSSGVKIG